MTQFYDARGNIYGVASPAFLRQRGIEVPDSAAQAARTREAWAASAIRSECEWGSTPRPANAKAHRCDGLLVGPFQAEPPFDLLIVNTDGSLAERIGNGVTIFAHALTGQGLLTEACDLRLLHDQPEGVVPVGDSWSKLPSKNTAYGFGLALGVAQVLEPLSGLSLGG
ncbi:diaminopimelate epimerase [Enterocytozoon bieneusi H348]|nr:diaminopimelate epimerase [Enterocytozoon bieneusi H348]|eukprot:XP_002651216.1 diaminopimelate epimerase [Enterocytozoon bieneusi H348]